MKRANQSGNELVSIKKVSIWMFAVRNLHWINVWNFGNKTDTLFMFESSFQSFVLFRKRIKIDDGSWPLRIETVEKNRWCLSKFIHGLPLARIHQDHHRRWCYFIHRRKELINYYLMRERLNCKHKQKRRNFFLATHTHAHISSRIYLVGYFNQIMQRVPFFS